MSGSWSLERAEDHLLGLELFGMRFGLDRMRRLMTALGSPEQTFPSIHVVGTNGKSSTVRMVEELMRRHGYLTGSYTSPHLVSFAERIRVNGEPIDDDTFARAVQRAAGAAAMVNRTLPEGEAVTQFELLTAAAFFELGRRFSGHRPDGGRVVVVEAGLGGRYDATNVIPSRVQVLTNVGLDHTRWLGPTITDIAAEKLAVVRDNSSLVVGAGLHPDAEAVAREVVAQHPGTALVQAADDVPGVQLLARGAFQRRNFALAAAAVEALDAPLDPAALSEVARSFLMPGRCEVVDRDPLTVVDGAHNPAGVHALVESLPELAGGPVVAVVSILEDKDAAGMLRELLPCCAAVVLTSNANPRALPPATLQSLARQVGGQDVPPLELVADPHAAVRRARELAGADGTVLVAGSIYLVADLARAGTNRRASTL